MSLSQPPPLNQSPAASATALTESVESFATKHFDRWNTYFLNALAIIKTDISQFIIENASASCNMEKQAAFLQHHISLIKLSVSELMGTFSRILDTVVEKSAASKQQALAHWKHQCQKLENELEYVQRQRMMEMERHKIANARLKEENKRLRALIKGAIVGKNDSSREEDEEGERELRAAPRRRISVDLPETVTRQASRGASKDAARKSNASKRDVTSSHSKKRSSKQAKKPSPQRKEFSSSPYELRRSSAQPYRVDKVLAPSLSQVPQSPVTRKYPKKQDTQTLNVPELPPKTKIISVEELIRTSPQGKLEYEMHQQTVMDRSRTNDGVERSEQRIPTVSTSHRGAGS